MVVYKVNKSNALVLLQKYWNIEQKINATTKYRYKMYNHVSFHIIRDVVLTYISHKGWNLMEDGVYLNSQLAIIFFL